MSDELISTSLPVRGWGCGCTGRCPVFGWATGIKLGPHTTVQAHFSTLGLSTTSFFGAWVGRRLLRFLNVLMLAESRKPTQRGRTRVELLLVSWPRRCPERNQGPSSRVVSLSIYGCDRCSCELRQGRNRSCM